MKSEKLYNKVGNAAKWSLATQIGTKAITPITNMILTRLLAPEIFGVVVTVTMITSFANIFTDAGFQKYLVQHNFNNENDKNQYTNVAFWTNFIVSLLFWILIIFFRNPIANLLGNPGCGMVIAVASIQIPITSFSSIQESLFRRSFNFKNIFVSQILSALIPLIISVPLAIMGKGYWSVIIGNIFSVTFKAFILTVKSEWKPQFFYSIQILKNMLSYSLWMLSDSITTWLISWVDTLIIGSYLNEYYIGLYKNSLSMVNALMFMISSAITPVLFSALARLQNNNEDFSNMFLKVQKFTAYFLFPIGLGLYLYKDLATDIMFGANWTEAANIVGIWALTTAIRIVLVSLYSEVYRAKGLPKLCTILQVVDLVILIPTCLISVRYGFWILVYCRALVRLVLIIPELFIMDRLIRIRAKDIIKNLLKPILFTIIMVIIAEILITIAKSNLWSFISILICIFIYITLVFKFARNDVNLLIKIFKDK